MSKPTTERKGISKALRRFYGVGDFGFTLMTNVESYYFQGFLTNLAMFSNSTAGIISTVTTAVDACLSWIYGAVINSVKPKKWGRYRSWLIMMPWIVPFLYAFQFLKIGDGAVAAIIVTLGFISSHICWNFPYVANVSMIAVAGKTPDERAALASTRGAYANLSKVVFSYVCPVIATFFAGIIGETNQYGATAFVLGCIMAALYYAHFKMFEGYEVVDPAELTANRKVKSADRTGGMDLIRALLQNPPLIALLLADIAKFLFNFVVAGSAFYYFTYVALDIKLQAPYILLTNVFCVFGSYAAKSFAKKFSARNSAIGMFFIMAVVLVICNFLYTNVYAVIGLMALAQFGYLRRGLLPDPRPLRRHHHLLRVEDRQERHRLDLRTAERAFEAGRPGPRHRHHRLPGRCQLRRQERGYGQRACGAAEGCLPGLHDCPRCCPGHRRAAAAVRLPSDQGKGGPVSGRDRRSQGSGLTSFHHPAETLKKQKKGDHTDEEIPNHRRSAGPGRPVRHDPDSGEHRAQPGGHPHHRRPHRPYHRAGDRAYPHRHHLYSRHSPVCHLRGLLLGVRRPQRLHQSHFVFHSGVLRHL